MLPRACSRVPALTSVVLYQDLKRAASMSRASAELTILGVNRESSKSAFLLGNSLYLCLHLLGFCNFEAGFGASSSLQMALQERQAFSMGFVKKEGEKEVGSWTSLTHSNLVSVIKVAKMVCIIKTVCSAGDVGSLFKRRDRTSDGLIVVRAIF